mmetsp:Transcript_86544/g.242371  ORF Transcript_86544/g.242371 Transcript_86544/m.242371 type:complete len:231 (+) Transcript_86544:600-1292(+)
MHVLALSDCGSPKRDMDVTANLVHHDLAVNATTYGSPALLRGVKDRRDWQLFRDVGILEFVARVAALVILVFGVETRHARPLLCPPLRCHVALWVQWDFLQPAVHVDLVVASRIHRVDRNLVAAEMGKSDIQANRQLLVDPCVHRNAVHDLTATEIVHLSPKEDCHYERRDHSNHTSGLAFLQAILMDLHVDIKVFQGLQSPTCRGLNRRCFAAPDVSPAYSRLHGGCLK